jgi:hypothetical protein
MSAAWRDLAGFQQELQRGLIEKHYAVIAKIGAKADL